MITDQAMSDLKETCGKVREDYFGLLYLEEEFNLTREKAINQIGFGNNDYGLDGYHFDEEKRNVYLYQFKYSKSYQQFKPSFQRLIDCGIEQVFSTPNLDEKKNQLLLQIRSCLNENRNVISQIFLRFVFTGDPASAENSTALDKLREDLETRKHFIDSFFKNPEIQLIIDFKSTSGKVGATHTAQKSANFIISMDQHVIVTGPSAEQMHVGFVRLEDLRQIHTVLGPKFFDRNVRYGLGESEAVNRAILKTLRDIVVTESVDPELFAFNHNGITLYAEKFEKSANEYRLTAPRLLNGAQTVTTVANFFRSNKSHPKLAENRSRFECIRVLAKIMTAADPEFITSVTINNNRQNPVEPWNLHANDLIQLELQDKFRDDIQIYYERQENAFNQLATDDLQEYGISEESKAIQMLKLTQVFLLTDGNISRLSEMRRVFEDDKIYDIVFRQKRLDADSRHILLCYKIQFRLRKLAQIIEQKGSNKYAFIHRARNLMWALLCQGLLNQTKLEDISDKFGTNMGTPHAFIELLSSIAKRNVAPILSDLMKDKEYKEKADEGNYSFLRTDVAFSKCMTIAYKKFKWNHRKLQ